MERKRVARAQFDISVRGIIHKPTDATYAPHPGSPFSGTMNKSQLGNVLKRGDEYSPYEVEEMMERLWAEYVETNPSNFQSPARMVSNSA